MMETTRDLFIMCWPDWTSISLCWPCSSYSSPLLKLYLCPHCNLLIYSKLYFFFHFPSFNCPLPFSDVEYSLIMAVRYMPKLISYFFYCLLFCPKFCLFCWKWRLLSVCCYFVLYGSVQFTTLFPNSIHTLLKKANNWMFLWIFQQKRTSFARKNPFWGSFTLKWRYEGVQNEIFIFFPKHILHACRVAQNHFYTKSLITCKLHSRTWYFWIWQRKV